MNEIAIKLKHLRLKKGLTVNAIAVRAGIATSFLAKIEKGNASPTIVTLKKILQALDMEIEDFFSQKEKGKSNKIVYSSGEMNVVSDKDKRWIFALPKSRDIKAQISYEEFFPHTKKLEFETHSGDICGYVLEGELTIEVKNRGEYQVKSGDAFYVKAGKLHAGKNNTNKTVKLVCIRIL